MNLNSSANIGVLLIGFSLFKVENLPAIVDVDGEEGDRCYRQAKKTYDELRRLSKQFKYEGVSDTDKDVQDQDQERDREYPVY